jgi:hypothetical protein
MTFTGEGPGPKEVWVGTHIFPETPEAAQRRWLNTTLTEIRKTQNDEKHRRTNVAPVLGRVGLRTVRDALVAGSDWAENIVLINRKRLYSVMEVLLANEFGIEYPEEASPEFAARICRDLTEVNSAALGNEVKAGFTVAHILTMTDGELKGAIRYPFTHYAEFARQPDIRTLAINFQTGFDLARQTRPSEK